MAALLAVVLFAGIGLPTPSDATTPGQEAAQGDLQPGINAATGLLLSLTVFPSTSHPLAPNFELTDQHGQPVSMNEFRGKVVVFSDNDDQCQDLCTLLANDITVANRDLGAAAKNVVWLSVNANPFYPQVASVKTWTDQHGLGGQSNWRFGTSTPAVLQRIWDAYGIAVQTDAKTRTVTHGTELLFIDPTGRERSSAEYGTAAANTSLYAHGIAQMADDLLPNAEQTIVAGPQTPAPTKHNATVSAIAKDFSLPYLPPARGTFRLSTMAGRYVVLNFWSSTCTICRVELPHIEAAYRYARSEVAFVGIDVSDTDGAAKTVATRAGLTYPLVSDHNGLASGDEQITGLPFTVIINPQGQILVRHPGDFTSEQLQYLLENYVPTLPAGN